MAAVLGDREVGQPPQRRQEMLFGEWVVHGPPGIDEPVGTRAANRRKHHARQMELGLGQVRVRVAVAVLRLAALRQAPGRERSRAAGDSGQQADQTDDPSDIGLAGGGLARQIPVLRPAVASVTAVLPSRCKRQ